MNLPERNVALAWVGRTVVDRDGAEIGACTAVFTDDATELAEWVCSEFDGTTVFIPAVGAAETDGLVQVVITREDVAGAPPVGGPEHISGDEEVALYRHYGIPHSRDASPTVLPTEDAVPPAGESAGTAESAGTVPESAPAAPAPESVGTPDMAVASGSAAGPDAAPSPASEEGDTATSQPAPKGRSRIMLAMGGASALAVAAGAVLQARRRQQQRQRSLAARIETTTRVVRQRKAGAAAVTSALAGAVIAARRRRSRDTRETPDSAETRNTRGIRDLRDTPSY